MKAGRRLAFPRWNSFEMTPEASTAPGRGEKAGDAFEEAWPKIDAIGGFLVPGQERCLFDLVRALPNDAVILEVGSFLGRSTVSMALACRGTDRHIFAVDTFEGNATDFVNGVNNVHWTGSDFLHAFEANLERSGVRQYVTPLRGTSRDIAKHWAQPIDLLFLDGSHEFEDVKADFEDFFRWLVPGGCVALHDVTPSWPGVLRVWRKQVRPQTERHGNLSSLAYGYKPVSAQPVVNVVLPVHNRAEDTRRCLQNLQRQDYAGPMPIFVVDDGSTDGTAEMLRTEFPSVRVLRGDGNLWWTGAMALAVRHLMPRRRDGDYLLAVNNDSLLPKDAVSGLVEVSTRERRAVVSGAARSPEGHAIPVGGRFHWGRVLSTGVSGSTHDIGEDTDCVEVDAVFGRLSLFPMEVFAEVGNFDSERFPHYWGDTEFCVRIKKQGSRRILVTNRVTATCLQDPTRTGAHLTSGPIGLSRAIRMLVSRRSNHNLVYLNRFIALHAPAEKKWRMHVYLTARNIWRCFREYWPIYIVRVLFRKAGSLLRICLRKARSVIRICLERDSALRRICLGREDSLRRICLRKARSLLRRVRIFIRTRRQSAGTS